MKKQNVECTISIKEMLDIDHKSVDYVIPNGACAKDLFDAYCIDFDNRAAEYKEREWYAVVRDAYGLMFIFECGRVFGIRMERARHRKGAVHDRF